MVQYFEILSEGLKGKDVSWFKEHSIDDYFWTVIFESIVKGKSLSPVNPPCVPGF